MANFTHINDSEFPYPEGINPYKYQNSFNYSKYDKTQMKITVCSVPWDVGLIHVGNAQIGGLGNVVYFESKNARDNWFLNLDNVYSWETKYREYHTDGYIEVPLPYEKAILYNYVFVEYTRLPVDYAEGVKDKFFFFIRELESMSPSNCRIKILRDTWQTFIYDTAPNIKYMMLERGHAPLSLIDAHRYLEDPINNNDYLLAEDVNYGEANRRIYTASKIFNSGDMWAVIISSGNPRADWGTKASSNWNTPNGTNLLDGQPSYYAFAIEPANLNTLLANIDSDLPQFKQTIKAIFFVAKDLVTLGNTFTFARISARTISQKTQAINFLNLTMGQFGYENKYKDLAKLYTYPYAYLEITDEQGAVSVVKIEETSGNLSLQVTTSLAYPWLTIDSHINGIGSDGAEIEFSNVSEHSFNFGGDWYSQLRRWNIPTFAVTQAASIAYDYATHFDRAQKAEENEAALQNALDNAATAKANADASVNTAKTNADASAATAKANADVSAATAKANADASAATAKANADASALANRTIALLTASTTYTNNANSIARIKDNIDREQSLRTSLKNANNNLIDTETYRGNTKITNDSLADINCSLAVVGAENEATALTAANNAISGVLSSAAMGAIGGTAMGTIVPGAGNVVGAGAGAIGGAVAGLISAAGVGFSAPISMTTNETLAQATRDATVTKRNIAINYNNDMASYRTSYNTSTNAINNQAVGEIAARNRDVDNAANSSSKSTNDSNAATGYNTSIANNLRTYELELSNNLRDYNTADANITRENTTALDNNARTYNTAVANNSRTQSKDISNNARTYNNAITIANRNKRIADDSISNAIKQAGLDAPKEYGTFANGETSITRPQGVFCNVVTQSKDAIAQAGDYFLRFGYAVNRQWNFTTFNLMPHFTYWKASDLWVESNNVPDAYMDEIRFFLLGGVCVWRNPEDIGRISIYEN